MRQLKEHMALSRLEEIDISWLQATAREYRNFLRAGKVALIEPEGFDMSRQDSSPVYSTRLVDGQNEVREVVAECLTLSARSRLMKEHGSGLLVIDSKRAVPLDVNRQPVPGAGEIKDVTFIACAPPEVGALPETSLSDELKDALGMLAVPYSYNYCPDNELLEQAVELNRDRAPFSALGLPLEDNSVSMRTLRITNPI